MTAPMPARRPGTPVALSVLRVAALLAAIGAILSPILAIGPLFDIGTLNPLHGVVGTLNLAFSLVAAAGGVMWARASGHRGLMFHALALPLMAVVQIGLGEMRVEFVHIVLGFLYLVTAVALFTLALRRTTVVGDPAADRRTHA